MSRIRVMDELLANKIAAGEVVEKCASVVKELVENSIDALATEIKVDLKEAGTKEIKVSDNGIGMDRTDAVKAFYRHATSKIIEEEDLYHINTLGFRGEALASIASVSKVDLRTCSDEVGTHVVINGGKLEVEEPSEARKGTIIAVSDLFYNTPARLKHLKSLNSELANITDFMNKIALSHPSIKFILTNNNNTILNTSGDGNLLKVIGNVYGMNTVKLMEEVRGENNDYEIYGYISKPELTRGNRNAIVTIVNGRVVKNQELNRTIDNAYSAYKHETRYPIVTLEIELDPSLVDVNIHPTKMDIKFSKMEELLSLVSNIIKEKLSSLVLIPEVREETPYEKVEDKNTYEEVVLTINQMFSDSKKENLLNKESLTKESIKEVEKSVPVREEKKELPELYVVGVVHGTYIVCQNDLGMYLIDQHAAKERINYEKFRYELGHPTKNMIAPIFPYVIELSTNEALLMKENIEHLRDIGFDASEIGINSIVIKAHPTWLTKGYEEEQTRSIVDLILECAKDFDIAKFREKAAAMLSCKHAIKANQAVSLEELTNLINDLRKCNNPYNCPHGRPTIIFYSTYEIEKQFKRTGFN